MARPIGSLREATTVTDPLTMMSPLWHLAHSVAHGSVLAKDEAVKVIAARCCCYRSGRVWRRIEDVIVDIEFDALRSVYRCSTGFQQKWEPDCAMKKTCGMKGENGNETYRRCILSSEW